MSFSSSTSCNIQFGVWTPEAVRTFLPQVPRYFYSQSPAFTIVHERMGQPYEWLGLKIDGEPVAVAKILYYRRAKCFLVARINYAPLLSKSAPVEETMRQYLQALLSYLRRNKRVLQVRVAPLTFVRSYEDFTPGEANPDAVAVDSIFRKLGFEHINRESYEDASLSGRFFYTKSLANIPDMEAFWASTTPNAQRAWIKARDAGVQIRLLMPEEFPLYQKMRTHTLERTGMNAGMLVDYAQTALESFEDCLYPLAYLDCKLAEEKLGQEIASLKEEIAELDALIEAGAGRKHAGPRKKLQIRLTSLENRLEKIRKLSEKEGNIVPLAASAFYFSPSDAVYLESVQFDAGKAFSAVYAIHHAMVQEALRRGCTNYNFFYVSGDLSEAAPDAGVITFKRSFAGYLEECLGTYEYNLHPFMMKLLRPLIQ